MGDSAIEIHRWKRIEYERLADAEILGSLDRVELLDGHMVVKEPPASPHIKGSLYARAGILDYWIVNLPDRRVEVYRDPMPDAGAVFGWRYGSTMALRPNDHASPLPAPAAVIPVAELLP